MRTKDSTDGRLISLDLGNIGDNDKGVKVQVQNVWFKYPTRDTPILNGLDLTVSSSPSRLYSFIEMTAHLDNDV